jgi:hypothetical protein
VTADGFDGRLVAAMEVLLRLSPEPGAQLGNVHLRTFSLSLLS